MQQGNNQGPPTAAEILSSLKTNLAAAQALFPQQEGGGSNLSAVEQAQLSQLNVQGQAMIKGIDSIDKKGDKALDFLIADTKTQRNIQNMNDPNVRADLNAKYNELGEQVIRESGQEYEDEEDGISGLDDDEEE